MLGNVLKRKLVKTSFCFTQVNNQFTKSLLGYRLTAEPRLEHIGIPPTAQFSMRYTSARTRPTEIGEATP